MRKYKVCVYAICKNEEKFIERWVKSMSEADNIYVLDTGSTDNSVQKLRDLGVLIKSKKIEPWRFDTARNESLRMVPSDTDICVCTDLDEVLESGWREKLEQLWDQNITRLRYNYNWSFDEYNKPAVNFYTDKIHKRNDYKWTHPVHEVLTYTGQKHEKFVTTDKITLNHYPDLEKSRSSYLPLLELSVKEDPNDDRNMHYLGREYMYYGMFNECIDTLIKHLSLKTATWKDERSASMRFIARSYQELNRFEEARMWLDKAIIETPYLREPYVERAILEYKKNNWDDVTKYCNEALKIVNHEKNYINEKFCWDHTIFDLLSISNFYQNNLYDALKYSNKAMELAPNNKRLIENNKIIKETIEKVF